MRVGAVGGYSPVGDDAGAVGPVLSRRIPGPVQHFVPVGRDENRPGVAWPVEQNKGTHVTLRIA